MITPSFGLTATERVLPKLALDFTTASLDSRITFTRTTDATHPATYVNSTGYITAATNNQPRFDYNPVTLACKGLLIEESRTNTLVYSTDPTNATYWLKGNCTGTANQGTSPDGQNNATKITLTTNSNYYFGYARSGSSPAYSANTTYTGSVWIKNINATKIQIGFYEETPATSNFVDVTSQVNSSTWTRVNVSYTTSAGGGTYLRFYVSSSSTATGQAYLVWGPQLEAGAFATSYIPTTTTALTRNADVATMTGTNFSSWFNASEGTFEIEQSFYSVASVGGLVAYASTGNYIFSDTTAGGVIRDRITAGSVTQTALSAGTITNNTTFKNTHAYKSSGAICALNGASPISSGAITIPSGINMLQFNSSTLLAVNSSGYVKKLNYWPLKLTSSEVQAFSK